MKISEGIQYIVANRGLQVIKEQSNTIALLSDLCPEEKKTINKVRLLYSAGVVDSLVNQNRNDLHGMQLAYRRAVSGMESYGMTKEASEQTVRMITDGLNWPASIYPGSTASGASHASSTNSAAGSRHNTSQSTSSYQGQGQSRSAGTSYKPPQTPHTNPQGSQAQQQVRSSSAQSSYKPPQTAHTNPQTAQAQVKTGSAQTVQKKTQNSNYSRNVLSFFAIPFAIILLMLVVHLVRNPSGQAKTSSSSRSTATTATTTAAPSATPAPTPADREYDSKGNLIWANDSSGTTWYYYYDTSGSFSYKLAMISSPGWSWGEKQNFSNGFNAYPAVFNKQYDNVIGITFNYSIFDTTGNPYGTWILYCKEPSKSIYSDMGHFELSKDTGGGSYSASFEKPISITAVCPRPYINSAYSFSCSLEINSLTIISYNY